MFTRTYNESVEFSPHPSGFPTKISTTFLISPMCATYLAHVILFVMFILIIIIIIIIMYITNTEALHYALYCIFLLLHLSYI
jgi:hypothetical protein